MGKIKFLHCADLHLDMPFTSLGSGNQKSEIRRADLKNVFTGIIELAKKNQVDLLLISGDIYEHQYVKNSNINYINDKFSEISHVEVFIVPGNHDPYILKSYYRDFKWASNVHVLNDENSSYLLKKQGVCIYGAGFNDFSQNSSNFDNLKATYSELINILLFHGTVDLNINQDNYNHVSSKQLNDLNMDYVALGHFHNRIDDVGGYGKIYNPGSPEPLGFDEEGEHGVYIGTIKKDDEKSKIDIEFVKTAKKYYKNISIEVKGCNTDEQVIKAIKDELSNSENTDEKLVNGLFYFTLKGFCEKGFKPNIKFIEGELIKDVFFIKVKDQTRMDYDIEEILKEPGLRGLFTQKLMKRIDDTKEENEKEMLKRALYYGLDALDRGKVEI